MFNKTHRKVEITAPPSNLRLHHPPPALLLDNSKVPVIRQSSTPNILDGTVSKHVNLDTARSHSVQYTSEEKEKKKKFSLFKKKKDKSNDEKIRATRTPDVTGRKQIILNYPDSAPLVRRPHSSASDRDDLQRTGSQRSTKSGDFLNDDDEVDIIVQTDYPRHKSISKISDPPYDALEKYSFIRKQNGKQQYEKVLPHTRPAHHRPAPPPPSREKNTAPPPPSQEKNAAPPPPRTAERQTAPPTSQSAPTTIVSSLPMIPGLVGIKNHGNTCYMNAVIQCLSNNEQFLYFILSGQCQKEIATLRRRKKRKGTVMGGVMSPPTSDDDSFRPDGPGAITEYLVLLIKSLWNGQYEGKISAVFKEVIGLWMEQYRGRSQHDAQEFLLGILGYVHDSLTLASRQQLSKTPPPEGVAMDTSQNSLIYQLFGGEYRSTLHCPECGNDSNTFDPFLCTSLSVPRRGTRPIYITMARRHQNTTKLMIFGLSVKVTATIHEIQKQLALESRTLPHYLVIGDMLPDGFNQFFHSNDPVAMIPENTMLFAYEVTPYKGDFMFPTPHPGLPDHKSGETIFIILQNRVGQGEYSKKFGSPLCLRIWRDFTYSQLQSVVFKGIKKYLNEGVNSEVVCRDYIFFKCRVVDGLQGQEYLDPYSPSPLISPSVEKAIAVSKMWGYESHIKIIAEWEQWVKDCVCTDMPETDPPIHDSAHVIKKHYDVPLEATLDDCLTWHTQEEKLEGDETWTCPKCNRPQNGATKTITFSKLPDVFLVHLKRFEQDEYSQSKLNTLVKFPVKGLDMTSYLSKVEITRPSSAMASQHKIVKQPSPSNGSITIKSSTLPNKSVHFQESDKKSSKSRKFFIFKKNKKSKKATNDQLASGGSILSNKNQGDNIYDLYAVCNHHGDMNRGHYIAHCLNPINNKWYIYDDHYILPVASEDHLITQNAYILFYVKRNARMQWLKSIGKHDPHWIQQLISQYSLDINKLPPLDHSLFSPQRQGSVTSANTLSTASGVSPDNVFFPSHIPQLSNELAPPAPFHLRQYSAESSSGGPMSPHSTITYPYSLPSPSVFSTPTYLSQQYITPPSNNFTKRAGSFHGNRHNSSRHYSESHSATRV